MWLEMAAKFDSKVPGGFRADSFVRQIYRRVETDRPATKDMNE
jgi:hypothetical protein